MRAARLGSLRKHMAALASKIASILVPARRQSMLRVGESGWVYSCTAMSMTGFAARPGRDQILATVVSAHARRVLSQMAKRLPDALSGPLDASTLSAILYREHRSAAIHEFPAVFYENKFYEEDELYWAPYPSESSGWYLRAEFPANYLRAQLVGSLEALGGALVHSKKLPSPIYFARFDMPETLSRLDLLDQDSIRDVEVAPGARHSR